MITSAHNPKVQRIRSLLSRRQEREKSKTFVVEGVRLLEEALSSGWSAESVFFSDNLSTRGRDLLPEFANQGAEVEEISESLMKSLADTETPQGILAVLRQEPRPIPAQLDYVLVIDQVRDPGNLGTILRTAGATGVQSVWLTPGTTDAFAPKVLRAGMGAHFHLSIHVLTLDEIENLCREKGLEIYLAEVDQAIPCWNADFSRPLALVIGGEAEGAGQEISQMANQNVLIPMPGKAESLNAGIAASILMYEIIRQRSKKNK